ncbi:MAG: hypothetical protein K8R54_08540 [Bacteroidales bacterium]|nr:hypothetical protein [Bacteroidales bacterium]
MPYTNIIDGYKSRKNRYSSKLLKLKNKNRLISYIRALIFVISIVIIYFSKSIDLILVIILLIILFSVFLFLVKQNINLKKAIKKNLNLITINDNELIALNGTYDKFHSGNEYIDFDHPFSYDLDIFGKGSLFQYINRTSTIAGKNQLAEDLTEICLDKQRIEERQVAVKELSKFIDWRQNFTVTSLICDDKFNEKINSKEDKILNNLLKWANESVVFINKKIWKYLLYILPGFTFVLLILGIFEILPYAFMILSALINISIIGFYLKKINSEHTKLGKRTNSLKKIKELIGITEFSNFTSNYLQKLQNKLTKNQSSYSQLLKLNKILQAFDIRLNMLVGVLLNAFLLWDLQILHRLEKQKKILKQNISNWFIIIGEFDALVSFANFHYNNPDYSFPNISEEEFIFKIKSGGHPLIYHKNRVTNDFEINGLKKISIITGANMAGKSTFLRTTGTNMVLAASGAPVCAEEMTFTPIPVYTSVRTNDSLHKNESYFYAELMRLKKITDYLKSGKKLFIILDEMLKGTNSKDKHTGSKGLIEQLIRLNASGLAATHDIQLGKLSEDYPINISNKRFEVEILNNELVFDYKLKEGISQNLNASFLMKKYGIIE